MLGPRVCTQSISVVVPTWCEAVEIASCVACAQAIGDEVVVADANSPDGTATIAERAGARVVQARRGRGLQLHAGAAAARGNVLLFLHADTRLPPEARAAVLDVLKDDRIEGGNFRLCFLPATPLARIFDALYDLRRRALAIYYGDSALFVRRAVYEALGGFRPLPLLEDYEFIRRLERRGRTRYVRAIAAATSSRRYARRPARTLLAWVVVQALYSLGVSPHRLIRLYSDVR